MGGRTSGMLLAASALLAALPEAGTAQARPQPRPVAPLGSWISNQDYPMEAVRARIEGTTAFRLDIDIAGRVTGCTITQSAGSSLLDAATCRLLRSRSRFEPARNAGGQPIPSVYASRIAWRLPSLPPPPIGLMAALMDIGTDGRITGCTAETRGDIPEPVRTNLCSDFSRTAPPAMLVQAAKHFRRLAMIQSFSEGARLYPVNASEWGSLLGGSAAELTFSASGKSLSCRLISRIGGAASPCGALPAPVAGAVNEPGVRTIKVENGMFGLRR